MFMASRSDDGTTVNSAQFGPNLDINFRPLRRRTLRTNDSSKSNFLTFRIGYQYLRNFDKPNENRVQMALTSHSTCPGLWNCQSETDSTSASLATSFPGAIAIG
jgi:hypothetical protein